MRYYWNVCQSHDEPDGPAKLIGPFDSYDAALFDIFIWTVWKEIQNQKDRDKGYPIFSYEEPCDRKHFIGWGTEIPKELEGREIKRYTRELQDSGIDLVDGFENGGRERTIAMITNRRVGV